MSGADSKSLAEVFSYLVRVRFDTETTDAVLTRSVQLAADVVTGTGAASITVRSGNRFSTVCSSNDLASRLDAFQYRAQNGPCLEAIRTNAEIRCETFKKWPSFASNAEVIGLAGVLSTPIPMTGIGRGCLNLYAGSVAFTDEAAATAGVLAEHLGPFVGNAITFREANVVKAQLKAALETRELVGLAKGILMERERCNEPDAFRLLVTTSQRSNRKLRDVAAEVVATSRTAIS
jgi:ANTAR domain